jgi:hypothetical protein
MKEELEKEVIAPEVVETFKESDVQDKEKPKGAVQPKKPLG